MSFTKGFQVNIIIFTLNQQQDTQRTTWAGSRAEGGKARPWPAVPHHVPLQHVAAIQMLAARANPAGKHPGLLDSWMQKRFLKRSWSTHQPLNAEERPDPAQETVQRRLRRSHSSRPQPPPSPNNCSSVPSSQGGRNWKHVSIEAQLEFHEFHYSQLSQHFLEWIL